jgi:Peptidase A4 family
MRMAIAVCVAALATLLGGAVAAPGVSAATAGPSNTVVSACGCWAGYVDTGSTYHSVGATWQVPSIPASKNRKGVDFWVGLGGLGGFEIGCRGLFLSGLEQIGIGDITVNGKVHYIPWWEALPSNDPCGKLKSTQPHTLPYSVKAGDFISASVSYSSDPAATDGTYYLKMSDSRGTNNTIWSVNIPVSGHYYNNNSAEVVLEPAGPPLPNFKQVFFDGVYVDNKPIGATNPDKIVWGANDHRIDIHSIGANGDNFLVTQTVPTTTPSPAPQTPTITSAGTYTQGELVYFDIHYADPGHDAEGFGFVGVNGSGWAEENHPFSSPSYGIVGPDSIAYPFNEACGTAQQYDSYVEAWIYDTAGQRSTPVVIHLVCAGSAGSVG